MDTKKVLLKALYEAAQADIHPHFKVEFGGLLIRYRLASRQDVLQITNPARFSRPATDANEVEERTYIHPANRVDEVAFNKKKESLIVAEEPQSHIIETNDNKLIEKDEVNASNTVVDPALINEAENVDPKRSKEELIAFLKESTQEEVWRIIGGGKIAGLRSFVATLGFDLIGNEQRPELFSMIGDYLEANDV